MYLLYVILFEYNTLALPIQIALVFTTHTHVKCLVFKTSGDNITYEVEHLEKIYYTLI